MKFQLDRYTRELIIEAMSAEEEQKIRNLVENFQYQDAQAPTMAAALLKDLNKGRIGQKTLSRFSKWCHTSQRYEKAQDYVCDISRIMFGFVLPRLWNKQNRLDEKAMVFFFDQLRQRGTLQNGHDKSLFKIENTKPGAQISEARLAFNYQHRISHAQIAGDADKNFLFILKSEIRSIRNFVKDKNTPTLSLDRAFFWLWLCYILGLFYEGALLFRRIDFDRVPFELKNTLRKIGYICEEKKERKF